MTELIVTVQRVRYDTIEVLVAVPEMSLSNVQLAYGRAAEAARAIPDGIEWKRSARTGYTGLKYRKTGNSS